MSIEKIGIIQRDATHLMKQLLVLFPELVFPFFSKRIALVLSCSNMMVGLGVAKQVFRLSCPSLLSAEGLTEQSDLHGHCCRSSGCRFSCLSVDRQCELQHTSVGQSELALFDLLSLFQFWSNTANIGPELHSMPINHLNIFLNVSPCKGLGRKSA